MAASGVLDATTVFLPQRITYPMQTIFDAPVIAPQLEEFVGTRLSTRKAGDGVLHFLGLFSITSSHSFQTNDLLKAWPASEKGHNPRTRLKRACDNTTMLFAVRLCFTQISIGFTLTGGGKTNE